MLLFSAFILPWKKRAVNWFGRTVASRKQVVCSIVPDSIEMNVRVVRLLPGVQKGHQNEKIKRSQNRSILCQDVHVPVPADSATIVTLQAAPPYYSSSGSTCLFFRTVAEILGLVFVERLCPDMPIYCCSSSIPECGLVCRIYHFQPGTGVASAIVWFCGSETAQYLQ